MKYLIVLFKNKGRKKILKKFKTLERAKKFYDNSIETNNIEFDKRVENGKNCSFELALVETDPTDFENYFIKDSMGRQVRVKTDDEKYKIVKINEYKVEDLIYDIQKNKKITFIDIFPHSLSEIAFNSTGSDIEYNTCIAEFYYRKFNIS